MRFAPHPPRRISEPGKPRCQNGREQTQVRQSLMLDRRNLLRAAASLGALGAFLRPKPAGAEQAATFEITRTEAEWRKLLSPQQFYVLRKHGTERAFTSPLDKEYGAGTYLCAGCDLPLFASTTK